MHTVGGYMKRTDEDFIGAEHPFPKEAPIDWRMAEIKRLRKKVRERKELKKKDWDLMIYYTKMFMYLVVALVVMGTIIAVII
jgi:hypothetical protein